MWYNKKMSNYWLLILIVSQPLLDVLAFFTASEKGTAAGYIRLGIMLCCGIYLLIKKRRSRGALIWGSLFALVFILHIANSFRTGYISLTRDLSYISRVAYMPLMAIFFCSCADESNITAQMKKGILINAAITACVIIISYISGTYTYTYGEGLGISGWVTVDNRCCHSDILSTLMIFAACFAQERRSKWLNVLLPLCIFALMYTNGTRACYYTLFAICAAYPVYIIISSAIKKEWPGENRRIAACTFALLFAAAIIAYPYSPRAKEEEYKNSHFSAVESEFAEKMAALGYDIYSMSYEEKTQDPVFYEALKEYYNAFCYGGIEQIVENFELEDIIAKYGATVDSGILGNTRTMKQKYASLIYDTTDGLTHLFGFEIARLGEDMVVDMENDYFAIFYYYGFFGLAVYLAGAAYLLFRVLRKLAVEGLKSCLTDLNFCLLLTLGIQLGLAYFSGAMLRRPNASIYFALVTGLLYYETERNSCCV